MNFIGGTNITNTTRKIIKLQNKYKFTPIFDYAKEGTSSLSEIKNNIRLIKSDAESCELNKFSYSLKLSTFGSNKHPMNFIIRKIKENPRLDYIFLDAEKASLKERNIYNEVIKKNNENNKIFKTYQMYKKSSFEELKKDIEYIPNIGIKLVRGAYLDLKDNQFYQTKKQTDENYNNVMKFLLENKKQNTFNLMLATHNQESIDLALKLIKEHDLNKNDVLFGQLLGFNEKASKYLSENEYQVYKYIPYGSYYTLFPYLLRRLYENYPILQHI